MDAKHWERLKDAFNAVIEGGAEHAEEATIAECAGDEQLLRELRPLVEAHFRLASGKSPLDREPLRSALEPQLPSIIAGRFRVIARLGSGSFGDVYRVADLTGGAEHVALKTLRLASPVALQYFKNEFRSLAGIFHPNIVALHELIAYRDQWMFTMEFVDGEALLPYLDAQPASQRDAAVRSCLAQMAEGLHALHQRHLLHRDIKPSNVIVTPSGRLVLLDFGLVRRFGDELRTAATFAGTPPYMSPEQASGSTLSEASDWYSMGVMLYQILTGRLPFRFDSLDALRRQQNERPPEPASVAPGVPADLNELCLRLLDPDPRGRASYADVTAATRTATTAVAIRDSSGLPFVGREQALRRLDEAYAAAERGPVLLHICGPSGVGKTVLLREFTRRAAGEPGTLVFSGRCYEGESVPFQAVDDLIDDIARYLARLPQHAVEQALPRNFAALVKMFPVLSQFLAGGNAPANLDLTEQRTRAFAALREMLGRLAERRRIALVIDDLQWGDADGCALLDDLLSSADSPPILAALAYRSEDIDESPWLNALRDSQKPKRRTEFIELDRLDSAEAAELAASLLGADRSAAAVDHAVEQSGGNPFLLNEIVRWVKGRGIGQPADEFSLADVVRSRMAELNPDSRRLLELIVVAGQPTEFAILQAAAGAASSLAALDELSDARFIRSRPAGDERLEAYHDRLRVTILAEMDPPVLAERHLALALALTSSAQRDPERIAVHFSQAGATRLSAIYALEAARRAAQVLAFNKAASLFEMAIDSETLNAVELRRAHRECADALANAGLGIVASAHYLAASSDAEMDERLECTLSAAEQLLYSGHIDRGLEVLASLLKQVDVALPSETFFGHFQLLMRRVRLRIRGLEWRERAAAEVPRKLLLTIDTCASVAKGLSLVDIARGAALQTTSLLLALDAGEPSRIARALAMEAAYASTAGVKAQQESDRLLAKASEIARRTGDHRAIGLSAAMAAGCAWNAGRWVECRERARAARETLRELHERVVWERDTASIFEVEALRWMGRWAEMKSMVAGLLEDARLRGDLYAQAILQMHAGSCVELANGNPEAARAGLALLEKWSNTGFHVEHLIELHNQVEIALYKGTGVAALEMAQRRWPALRRSLLLHVETLHVQMRSLRGRAAIAAATELPARRRELLRLAKREEDAIRAQNARWGAVVAALIEAGRKATLAKWEEATAALRQAEAAADETGMRLHGAFARRARGLLEAGEAGRGLVNSAEKDLTSEGITDPARLAAVFIPGFESIP